MRVVPIQLYKNKLLQKKIVTEDVKWLGREKVARNAAKRVKMEL